MAIFRWFRAHVSLAILVAVAACTSWHPYSAPPGAAQLPSPTRVTLEGGEEWVLLNPSLQGDTLLVGWAEWDPNGPQREYPLSSVRTMESREFSRGRTVALLAGGVVVGLAVGWILLEVWCARDEGKGGILGPRTGC